MINSMNSRISRIWNNSRNLRNSGIPGIQNFKTLELIQNFKNLEFRNSRNSNNSRNSGIPNFKNLEFGNSRTSKFQKFGILEFPEFRISRIPTILKHLELPEILRTQEFQLLLKFGILENLSTYIYKYIPKISLEMACSQRLMHLGKFLSGRNFHRRGFRTPPPPTSQREYHHHHLSRSVSSRSAIHAANMLLSVPESNMANGYNPHVFCDDFAPVLSCIVAKLPLMIEDWQEDEGTDLALCDIGQELTWFRS